MGGIVTLPREFSCLRGASRRERIRTRRVSAALCCGGGENGRKWKMVESGKIAKNTQKAKSGRIGKRWQKPKSGKRGRFWQWQEMAKARGGAFCRSWQNMAGQASVAVCVALGNNWQCLAARGLGKSWKCVTEQGRG